MPSPALVDAVALEDTTDVTPEEAGARQMALRIVDDEVHVVLRDPEHGSSAARSVEVAAGGPLDGSDPMAARLVPLWNAVQACLAGFQALLAPEVHEPETSSPLAARPARDPEPAPPPAPVRP